MLLNSILHPIIHEEIIKQIDQYKDHEPIIILDAPLLLENDLKHMVDELWLVSCTLETQIKRIRCRDDATVDQAKAIISKQMALSEKEKRADVVIDNNSSVESLYKQIDLQLKSL